MRLSLQRSLLALGLVPVLFGPGCGEPDVEVREAEPVQDAVVAMAPPPEEPLEKRSPDGLLVRVLERGEGPRARLGDRLQLHYRGELADGTEFRSTYARGIPETWTLGQQGLIPGLRRALLGQRAGARLEVEVPTQLAYGEAGSGAIPPGADLRFELHLVAIR